MVSFVYDIVRNRQILSVSFKKNKAIVESLTLCSETPTVMREIFHAPLDPPVTGGCMLDSVRYVSHR
jgi:hypothetical protein